MATLNTAQHFGLERELGSITPGRRADLILSSDLAALPIELVIARGQVMAENGKLVAELPKFAYPSIGQEHRACRPNAERQRISKSPRPRAPTRSKPASSASSKTRRRPRRCNARSM